MINQRMTNKIIADQDGVQHMLDGTGEMRKAETDG
jgi:hypothetical protein